MRFIRYAALLGGLVLLVGTSVLLINSRARERSDQIRQVESAADVISVAVRSNIASTRDAVEIAGIAAAQPAVDPARLADEIASMYERAQACVGTSVPACTGPDLFALPQVGTLTRASETDGDAVAGVDTDAESVLVVARSSSTNDVVTVVMQVPVDDLIDDETRQILIESGVGWETSASARTVDNDRQGAVVVDGQRRVEVTIGNTFVDGSITVETTVDSGIAIAGNRPLLYPILLGLGVVLIIIANWTLFVDRRSLQVQATTDELTGLVNRREFERLAEETLDLSDRFGTGLCVMVVDLNGFKQINDTMGHQFGDLVLKASAERLLDAVRDTDVVGRWGGDEFVILLPGLQDRTAVRNSAERISENLAGTPVVGDTSMTASIGAAIFPRHGDTLDTLMRTADVAMYGAKTTGVGYRIADTINAQGDMFDDDRPRNGNGNGEEPVGRTIDTGEYVGPDRRQARDRDPLPPPRLDPTGERERAGTNH